MAPPISQGFLQGSTNMTQALAAHGVILPPAATAAIPLATTISTFTSNNTAQLNYVFTSDGHLTQNAVTLFGKAGFTGLTTGTTVLELSRMPAGTGEGHAIRANVLDLAAITLHSATNGGSYNQITLENIQANTDDETASVNTTGNEQALLFDFASLNAAGCLEVSNCTEYTTIPTAFSARLTAVQSELNNRPTQLAVSDATNAHSNALNNIALHLSPQLNTPEAKTCRNNSSALLARDSACATAVSQMNSKFHTLQEADKTHTTQRNYAGAGDAVGLVATLLLGTRLFKAKRALNAALTSPRATTDLTPIANAAGMNPLTSTATSTAKTVVLNKPLTVEDIASAVKQIVTEKKDAHDKAEILQNHLNDLYIAAEIKDFFKKTPAELTSWIKSHLNGAEDSQKMIGALTKLATDMSLPDLPTPGSSSADYLTYFTGNKFKEALEQVGASKVAAENLLATTNAILDAIRTHVSADSAAGADDIKAAIDTKISAAKSSSGRSSSGRSSGGGSSGGASDPIVELQAKVVNQLKPLLEAHYNNAVAVLKATASLDVSLDAFLDALAIFGMTKYSSPITHATLSTLDESAISKLLDEFIKSDHLLSKLALAIVNDMGSALVS